MIIKLQLKIETKAVCLGLWESRQVHWAVTVAVLKIDGLNADSLIQMYLGKVNAVRCIRTS